VRFVKRFTTLNLCGMNLQDKIMILAKPIKNSKAMCSLQISDNSVKESVVAEFCSVLGVNRDFMLTTNTKRHKNRAIDPFMLDLS